MKEKLKNFMKNKIFIGSASAVLVIAIIVTAILLLLGGKADSPKEPEKPADTESGGNGSGIVIGGNPPVEEHYSCGAENHYCNAPEAHAYIQNLELEGCAYCGSHSCPSFYATDEWGGACPDATQCPSYNEKNDPILYCQTCGKKNGDGTSGTCVQYINACNCTICGEWVESRTCHSCK